MKWGRDKSGSNPQTYMVKVLGRFNPLHSHFIYLLYTIKLLLNLIRYGLLRPRSSNEKKRVCRQVC